MFKIDDKTYEIRLSRGDTATIDFQFTGDIPTGSDVVIMTLKRTVGDKQSKWEKQAILYGEDLARFTIRAEDTKDLPFGKYYYDLRCFFATGGSVTTILPPTPFYVEEVIGNDR